MSALQPPSYSNSLTEPNWVHIGPGRFHLAHQAEYIHRANLKHPGCYAVSVISLQSRGTVDRMAKSKGIYTLNLLSKAGSFETVIGVHREFLFFPEYSQAVLSRLASGHVKIISLTITEKGYGFDPKTKNLLWSPELLNDVYAETPKTAIGVLFHALRLRKQAGQSDVVLLSCDNVSHNGDILKTCLIDFASKADPEMTDWIQKHAICLNSMVDRIVPAGSSDAVTAETFSQWTVELPAGGDLPVLYPLQDVGLQLVKDVNPYEQLKLQVLNGSHLLLALVGLHLDFKYVREAIAHPLLQKLLRLYFKYDVQPQLPPDLNGEAYFTTVLERFSNPYIDHPLEQIATDVPVKISQRWTSVIGRVKKSKILPFAMAAFAVLKENKGAAVDDEEFLRLLHKDIHSFADFAAMKIAFAGWKQDLLADPESALKELISELE